MRAKVLFLAYSHGVGAFYTLTHQALALLKNAENTDFEIHIASTAKDQEPGLWDLLRANCPAERLHLLENEEEALASLVSELLASGTPVIVDLHGTKQLMPLRQLKKANPDRLKIIYEVHTYRNRQEAWRRWLYAIVVGRMLRRYCDYTFFPTPFAASHWLGVKSLFRGGHAGIVPMGLAGWTEDMMTEPPPGEIDEQLRACLNNDSLFKFVYLAKFIVGKGHDWLIEGMVPVLRRHEHARLVLAGADRGLMEKIKIMTRELGIAQQTLFPGHVKRDQVPWLCCRCQVGIVPSVSETFGRNYLEPWRAGIPVIGTRKGLAEWFLQDYYTGIGFEYKDREALALAADFMLTHPEDAREMGGNAAAMAKRLFTWERATSCSLKVYEVLVSSDKETG